MNMALSPAIASALTDIVGAHHVRLARACAHSSSCDRSGCPGEVPDAIVYPGSTSELVEVLRGAVAADVRVRTASGSVLIDGHADHIGVGMTRLRRILEISRDRLVARVQPAVSEVALSGALAAAGLTVAAASCSRSPCIKFDEGCVVAVEAVSSRGALIRAVRNIGGNGPDTVDLVLRTAGTFCLPTEITLALAPQFGPVTSGYMGGNS